MDPITPHLWLDGTAEDTARFHVDTFPESRIRRITRYDPASAEVSGQPEGSVMTVSYELNGQPFVALNGGPAFRLTPAISFFVSSDTDRAVNRLFETLSEDGEILMPLQEYPFSEKYGWVNDRFGVSWQLNFAPGPMTIAPSLMFVGDRHGRAEEAIRFYASLFEDSRVAVVERYGPGEIDPAEGTLKQGEFFLRGRPFRAMDSSFDHDFGFTEAVSFLVPCADQAEVDRFWSAFTAGGEESRCGWLKDGYGVSWQIVPRRLLDMLQDEDTERALRVTEAMLGMGKLDLGRLEEAYGEG